MNRTKRNQPLTVQVFAIALGLLAGGFMCGSYAQQPPFEPSTSSRSPGSEPPKLVLNSADGPPFSRPDESGIIDRVLKEAFRRVGITISIGSCQAERALLNVNEGIDDGTFSRITGMSETYPALVQVPQKLVDFEFVAFTRKVDLETMGWESLKPFDVAIVTGWKILEENVRGTRSLQKVRDQDLLFNLLAKDRVDLVVYSRLGGEHAIRELGLKGIKALEPPLASKEMFLYLNRKHAALVPHVSEALRTMNQDGTYQTILGRQTQP